MERKISISDLRKAVDGAYEALRNDKEGEIDPRNIGAEAGKFGIAVALIDGQTIHKGDCNVPAPMGSIIRVPLSSLLLEQFGVDKLIEKSGQCPCQCNAEKPKHLGLSAHSIRAFSALEPTGDFDSKFNFYENRMIDLMGSAPELNDKVYEALKKEAADENIENLLADKEYFLYDDAAGSIDLLARAMAMMASADQLAKMGATIAADGVNPDSEKVVYDGELSKYIVAMMAAKGPHKMNLPWLVATGIPAKASFGGTVLGIIPGVMAIAAYAPEMNCSRVSVKAARAIAEISRRLDLSVFNSAKVKIIND